MRVRERYPYRLVLLGGPYSGAIVDTHREPDPVMELQQPLDWCVCDDGSIVETIHQHHVYRMLKFIGNDFRRTAVYLCEGWASCRCGTQVKVQEGEPAVCNRCKREALVAV